jgi:cell division protein FtsB
MSWEQDPWAVPGGVYTPSMRGSGSGRGGRGDGRGRGGRPSWLWIVAACFVGYGAWTLIWGGHGIVTLRRLAAREALLKTQIAESQEKVRGLEGEVANIDQTRQRRARLDYGMARDNEIIYQAMPGPAPAEKTGAMAGTDAAGQPGLAAPGGADSGGAMGTAAGSRKTATGSQKSRRGRP